MRVRTRGVGANPIAPPPGYIPPPQDIQVKSGPFVGVKTPATYLQEAVTQLNYAGGLSPADATAKLNDILTSAYCTSQNPSPECSNPAAAAALVSQMAAQVGPPGSGPPQPVMPGVSKPSTLPKRYFTPGTVARSPGAAINPEAVPPSYSYQPPPQAPSTNYVYSGSAPAPAPTMSAPTPAPALTTAAPSWFTDPAQALIGGIPNWILLAAAGGALYLFAGGKR